MYSWLIYCQVPLILVYKVNLNIVYAYNYEIAYVWIFNRLMKPLSRENRNEYYVMFMRKEVRQQSQLCATIWQTTNLYVFNRIEFFFFNFYYTMCVFFSGCACTSKKNQRSLQNVARLVQSAEHETLESRGLNPRVECQ